MQDMWLPKGCGPQFENHYLDLKSLNYLQNILLSKHPDLSRFLFSGNRCSLKFFIFLNFLWYSQYSISYIRYFNICLKLYII